MISLIVCSVNDVYLQQLKQKVDKNIGVEHEWLIWNNQQKQLGLCEVYNSMAAKAKYSYLCFLHEDVFIETPIWGQVMIDIFLQDQQVGLVGVAGGKYKSELYSGWYSGGKQLDYYSVTHRINGKDETFYGPEKWPEEEVDVATIDGVFMFCTQAVWKQTKFNDQLLKGFHYYDIDFSLRVALQQKVVVTKKLSLIHYSKGGDFGDKWVRETVLFHDSMKKYLPFSVEENIQKDIDVLVGKYWLDWLKNMDISISNRLKWIRFQRLHLQPALWYSILKFVIYKPLRLYNLHKLLQQKKH